MSPLTCCLTSDTYTQLQALCSFLSAAVFIHTVYIHRSFSTLGPRDVSSPLMFHEKPAAVPSCIYTLAERCDGQIPPALRGNVPPPLRPAGHGADALQLVPSALHYQTHDGSPPQSVNNKQRRLRGSETRGQLVCFHEGSRLRSVYTIEAPIPS